MKNRTKTKADLLPIAGSTVDGRVVTGKASNVRSIDSSLDDYAILDDIRDVSMDYFSYHEPYSASELKRTQSLAQEIKESNTINPLIIVEDLDGFYILEGGHRFDALNMLGAKSFPALVVKDLSSLREEDL
jgi:hypothetical protein